MDSSKSKIAVEKKLNVPISADQTLPKHQQDKDLKFTRKGKCTKLNLRAILKKKLVKKKQNLD